MLSVARVLKAAVLAGLIGGGGVAGFHLLLAEPVLDRAIALEERSHPQGQPHDEPVVSRRTQKVGLVVGFLLFGVTWGLLFGAVYGLAESRLPGRSAVARGWRLAALGAWSVTLFPFLKYPANPPGVGEPTTIWYRQALYFGFIALSVLGVVVAVGLQRHFASGGRGAERSRVAPAALGFYALYAVAVYVLMPANPDPIRLPGDLVWTFRAVSFTGLAVFWIVLGGAFGWLASERA